MQYKLDVLALYAGIIHIALISAEDIISWKITAYINIENFLRWKLKQYHARKNNTPLSSLYRIFGYEEISPKRKFKEGIWNRSLIPSKV